MITSYRLGISELRRMLAGRLPRLAIIALAVIPSLYAGLYLFANYDPYGNLEHVPAALVVQDDGTTVDGKHVSYGEQVAEQLEDDGGFGWVRTSQADAESGVRSGRFDAALIIGPTFSKDLTSSGDFKPRQASLVLVTNDANNYLARTISDTIVGKVRDALAQQVGSEAANRFLSGFASIHANIADAVTGGEKLADGAAQLQDGAGQLVSGSGELATGAASASSGAHQLVTGATKLDSGAQTLSSGASSLASGASQVNAGAQQLADGTGTLASGANELAAKAPALQSGAQQLADGASQLSTGASSLADGLGTLKARTADLPTQTKKLAQGSQQVAEGNRKVADAADTVVGAANDLKKQADGATTQARKDLEARLAQLVSDGVLTRAQADDILKQFDEALDSLKGPVDDALDQANAARDDVDKLADGAQQVADGNKQLAASTPALTQGIADADAGAVKVAAGARSLDSGAGTLASGAGQAAAGAQQLAAGATKVDDGASQLADNTPSLASGATKVADGASSLADGTGELVGGARSLASGTDQLATGATSLHTGAKKLDSGAGDLTDGADKLASGLRSGLGQIPNLTEEQRRDTADTIADPVTVAQQQLAKAGTYGAGLAPFFLSLATWIGAYVLFLLVRPLSRRALAAGRGGLTVALGGLLTPALIAVVQVIIMLTVTVWAVGIHAEHVVLTGVFLALVAVTFVAIMQMLNVYLGTAGQFLGLVLMLVQLVTAGGTFPWQTIPEPLRTIHRFLPMSYSVEGLRQLLFGGQATTVLRDIAVLLAFLVVAVGLTAWKARRQRVWRTIDLEPELVL